jgi:hypothetical protein
MKLADKYADACYKYPNMYGELCWYTHTYDDEPRWSWDGFYHDVLQSITEIQRIYNGGDCCKWGCSSTEEVINKMEESAGKLFVIIEGYKKKYEEDK